MNQREANKEFSFRKILGAASIRFREEGFSGVGIAAIMKDAGLTHGAFYAHFANKNQLIEKAFQHALAENRPRWISPAGKESWSGRLKRLAKRYLTRAHRDDLANSCALAALVSDAARANAKFHKTYEKELYKSVEAICDNPAGSGGKFDEALMFMALCVGGISLSRAVDDKTLSEKILDVCRTASERLTFQENPIPVGKDAVVESAQVTEERQPSLDPPPSLDRFPFKIHEKLRYADTDRQGHVNNAVFSTMLETGRVEILYNPSSPINAINSAFVIVHQSLDFLSEIHWPGQADIGSRILFLGKSSIHFGHALFQDGRCVARAKVVVVQMNEITKKSEPLTPEAVAYLSGFTA